MTNEISKKWRTLETSTPTLGIINWKFCNCHINELVQELPDNTSIFYYNAPYFLPMFLPIFFHYEWDEMFIETEASKHTHGYENWGWSPLVFVESDFLSFQNRIRSDW